MFRTTRKKPRKTLRSSGSNPDGKSSDDDDVEATANGNGNERSTNEKSPAFVLSRRRKKKRRSGIIIRSFDAEPDTDEVEATYRGNKKKKRSLGFGGGGNDNDDASQNMSASSQSASTRIFTDTDAATRKQATGIPQNLALGTGFNSRGRMEPETEPSYGKEALEKLKAAQRKRQPNENREREASDRNKFGVPSTPAIGRGAWSNPPFAGDTTRVLTGEEAIACRRESSNSNCFHEIMKIEEQSKDFGSNAENVDESSDWEDQVARRAGIRTSKTTQPATPAVASNLPALNTLRGQLQSTTLHLTSQESDVSNAIMRREADLAQLESDLKQHEEALNTVGLACEFYQTLRQKLALWIGALRHLQQRVDPIYEAVVELITQQYQDNQQEWMDWQDDAASVLQEASLLSSTVGRKPQLRGQKETSDRLDEFGRDIQSQFDREREKRYRSRTARHAFDTEETEDDLHDTIHFSLWMGGGDFCSRYKILMEALRVALSELDENYAAVPKLIDVFSDWKTEFADDFSQCYAPLSLGDLVAVLGKVEFCRSLWVESMLLKDGYTGHENKIDMFSWWSNLGKAETNIQSTRGAFERVLSKVYLPFLFGLLKRAPSFCFVSSRTSDLLAAYVTGIVKDLAPESVLEAKILESLSEGISWTLECVCIPIANNSLAVEKDHSERVAQAVTFARRNQGEWIQILLLNLLRRWVPLFQDTRHYVKIGEFLLKFLSGKYIFLLSSLDKTVASTLLWPVWRHIKLNCSDWLDSPALMLQGAPLRASVAAYGLL